MTKRNKHIFIEPILFSLIISLLIPLFFTSCGKSKPHKKKQIVLLSIDTLRGDHISPYGYSRDTSPFLSELVKESVYYTNTYINGCWTMPSHMSLLTGTLPSRHGLIKSWHAFQKSKYPTLRESIKNMAEILKTAGITTLNIARLPSYLGFGRGFDLDKHLDPFEKEEYYKILEKELVKNKDNDFFLFMHTWMVHAPYAYSRYLQKDIASEEIRYTIDNWRDIEKDSAKLSVNFRAFLIIKKIFCAQNCMDLYDGGITYVDYYLRRFINKCKELGIYDDLMFIVVSDHGEHFAEHLPDLFYGCHGTHFFEEFIKVPLIIKYPHQWIKPGKPTQRVSLIDVMPTVLDYYDVDIPDFVQGSSLLAEPPTQATILTEATSREGWEKKMLMVGHLKYIVKMKNASNPGRVNWESISQRKLFDLNADPLEQNNLYNDLKYRNLCISLEKTMKSILTNSSKNLKNAKNADVTEETMQQLKALGYL